MATLDPKSNETTTIFDEANELFGQLKQHVVSSEWHAKTHDQVEELLESKGRELLRQLYQAFVTVSGQQSIEGESVEGADGIDRTHRRRRTTTIASIFGDVRLKRTGYSRRGTTSLFPVDAHLNLPGESHSLGLRRRACQWASNDSFEETTQLLKQTTGTSAGKRQVEQLTARGSRDFDEFYRQRKPPTDPDESGEILVLSIDKKGIVVRSQDLREKTRKAAQDKPPELDKRRSVGERRGRKRMAVAAAVYTIDPHLRDATDVVDSLRGRSSTPHCARPSPQNKRVWANITHDSEQVVEQAFEEALRRDPHKTKRWVVLVDADQHQLCWIRRAARRHDVEVTIVLDLIHVIEYLWMAARGFHERYSSEAEQYVADRLVKVLNGKAGWVAGGMRRSAKYRDLPASKKRRVEKCANYLTNHSEYLRYDEALAEGHPISTGVIEGVCRHLIGDRLEITGARWSLQGAEAVLRLRALRASGDFEEYWSFHRSNEYRRNHASDYASGAPPRLRAGPNQPEMRSVK